MDSNAVYEATGPVELFPQQGGWHYVAIPLTISEQLADLADRGVIAITATVGQTTWDTSLLPMGDGSHFVALNAAVRSANDLELGGSVTIGIRPRTR